MVRWGEAWCGEVGPGLAVPGKARWGVAWRSKEKIPDKAR